MHEVRLCNGVLTAVRVYCLDSAFRHFLDFRSLPIQNVWCDQTAQIQMKD